MKNFIYAARQVFKGRTTNFIKLLSLTLGIAIGGLLLCRVAYERSYDTFWTDVDNIRYLEQNYTTAQNSDNKEYQMQALAPMAPEMVDKISSIVVATRFGWPDTWTVEVEGSDINVDAMVWKIDSSFFDVFDLKMLQGGDSHTILAQPNQAILTTRAATKLFGEVNPIGKQITYQDEVMTVTGICQDMPNNTYLSQMGKPEIMIKGRFRTDWAGGDSYYTFFRVTGGTDVEVLDRQINEVFAPKLADMAQYGFKIKSRTQPISNAFAQVVGNMGIIMSLLALALILIAGFNFALLSITSLASRAKEVGVHKASGARAGGIFALIIWETVIYTVLALGLAVVLVFAAQTPLQTLVGQFKDVFAFENLSAVGVMLILVIVVAGVIPASIFARIPVTQVFQRYTAAKAHWKQALLFVQFTSSVFVICFTFIIIKQYDVVVNKDLGYQPDNLVTVQLVGSELQRQSLVNELSSNANVEASCFSVDLLYQGLSGQGVSKTGEDEVAFSTRYIQADSSFFDVYGIKLIAGRSPVVVNWAGGAVDVVVSRELLRQLDMPLSSLGQTVHTGITSTITGIMPDIQTGNVLYAGLSPLAVMPIDSTNTSGHLTMRLTTIDREAIEAIQPIVNKYFPDTKPEINIYSSLMNSEYSSIQMFRDGVIMASVILIVITIMGITGYIGTETRRRAKEIAIRKIHGSTARAIIALVGRNIGIVAVAGIACGIPLAYIMGGYWQQSFVLQADINWWVFALGALIVIATVVICVVVQTWRIANSDPARSIKSE